MQPDLIYFFPLLLHEHPLHLKTFTSSKRSRFVLVQDYSSPVRKQEASRFNVSEGSQSLRVTWLFALGCRKTFQLSSEIKIVIWDAFRIKGETSVRRYKYTMQSLMSRHWRAAESVLFLFCVFLLLAISEKTKEKKQIGCIEMLRQPSLVLRLQHKYENRAEMINAYRTNIFLKCRKMLSPMPKRERDWKRGCDPERW